jgi:hypothetical protein
MRFFIEIIDKKKKSDGAHDDVYILYVKKYGIRTCNGLVKWYITWWCVHTECQKNYIWDDLT